MKENSIFIKEKRKDLFTRGFIILALMIVSLLCAFAPLLMTGIKDGRTAFYLIGGLLFVVFLSLFIYLIYKEFHPDTLLILGSRGFVDKKNVGDGIEIEWTNVASVKLLGNSNIPYLGITLENSDIVMAKMKKREAEEMRDNIDESLPHILIAQNEVFTPINELKDTFTRFVREARILNNDTSTQKPKQNPFTSDDVLRAFGKLPAKDESPLKSEHTESTLTDTINATPQEKLTDTITYNPNEDTYISELSKANEEPQIPAPVTYDLNNNADQQEEKEADTKILFTYTPENEDASFDELSAEINEFFARAKSSKITELGKILNETDVPYSLSKEQSSSISNGDSTSNEAAPKQEKIEIVEGIVSDTEIDYLKPVIETETATKVDDINYNNDFNIVFPDNLFEDNNSSNENSEVTFETLIQQSKELDEMAFKTDAESNDDSASSTSESDSSLGDTKEF